MFKVSTGLINRCLIKPSVIQCMGKKKKNLLKPLEGDEAKYINKTVIVGVNEPEYLSLLKPPIPFYNLINFQVSKRFIINWLRLNFSFFHFFAVFLA